MRFNIVESTDLVNHEKVSSCMNRNLTVCLSVFQQASRQGRKA